MAWSPRQAVRDHGVDSAADTAGDAGAGAAVHNEASDARSVRESDVAERMGGHSQDRRRDRREAADGAAGDAGDAGDAGERVGQGRSDKQQLDQSRRRAGYSWACDGRPWSRLAESFLIRTGWQRGGSWRYLEDAWDGRFDSCSSTGSHWLECSSDGPTRALACPPCVV